MNSTINCFNKRIKIEINITETVEIDIHENLLLLHLTFFIARIKSIANNV